MLITSPMKKDAILVPMETTEEAIWLKLVVIYSWVTLNPSIIYGSTKF